MDIHALQRKLDEAKYICSGDVAATLLVALRLGRPLLIEGPAGVGKTEIAKVMASALDRELVRLQCYEGLDESKAFYEWNYQKQLLSIQVQMDRRDADDLTGPSSATNTCWSGPCCGQSGPRSRWCCSSTRSTKPTRSSRRSFWSCSAKCR